MNTVRERFFSVLYELVYLFMNSFVAHIPIWIVRKSFYILFGMKIDRGSRILMGTVVTKPWKISIGKNSIVNEKCHLQSGEKIIIGDNVTIAAYSKIITGSHDLNADDFHYIESPVTIEDNVAVFTDSIVLPGAYLEKGSAFAAKSVIKKGVYKSNTIYAGNPAKKIGVRRISESYNQGGFGPWFR